MTFHREWLDQRGSTSAINAPFGLVPFFGKNLPDGIVGRNDVIGSTQFAHNWNMRVIDTEMANEKHFSQTGKLFTAIFV